MPRLKKHHHLPALHRYQLSIIFLFVAGFFLLFPYYTWVKYSGYDLATWQWYFVLPWTALTSLYCLQKRNDIPKRDAVRPIKRPIGHWVLLGIALLMLHIQPIDYERIYSVDVAFIVFSLFLADSYWDFTNRKTK